MAVMPNNPLFGAVKQNAALNAVRAGKNQSVARSIAHTTRLNRMAKVAKGRAARKPFLTAGKVLAKHPIGAAAALGVLGAANIGVIAHTIGGGIKKMRKRANGMMVGY